MEYEIILIGPCDIHKGYPQDATPIRKKVSSPEEAWEEAKAFLDDAVITTFWGTWNKKRVLWLCDDNGMAKDLMPNKQATLAYLDQCIPGTMHVILGPAVCLYDEELW